MKSYEVWIDRKNNSYTLTDSRSERPWFVPKHAIRGFVFQASSYEEAREVFCNKYKILKKQKAKDAKKKR